MITIIVLLILAGVSIATLVGDNGIINRTATAKQTTEEKAELEKVKLAVQAARIHGDSYSSLKAEDVIYALQKDNIAVTGSAFPLTATSGLYQFTIDENGNVSKKEEVKVTLKSGTSNIEITAENASTYYGRTITNYGPTKGSYQLFYIDFANDFGDGEGTIYLKATYSDDSSQQKSLTLYDTTTTPETLIKEMNPEWAKQDNGGKRAATDWNPNEKAVAWLCQPTRNASAGLWTNFYDNNKSSYINYVIGSPSVDMFIKSYNAVSAHTTKLDYAFSINATAGYRFKPTSDSNLDNGYGRYSSDYSVATDCNSMYCTFYKYWWLASPSAYGANSVFLVGGRNACLSCDGCSTTRGVCPLVSLKSGFIPELEN